jgi:hypothetical protein
MRIFYTGIGKLILDMQAMSDLTVKVASSYKIKITTPSKKDGAVSWGAAAAYRLARRDAAALFKLLSFISGTTSSLKNSEENVLPFGCN